MSRIKQQSSYDPNEDTLNKMTTDKCHLELLDDPSLDRTYNSPTIIVIATVGE